MSSESVGAEAPARQGSSDIWSCEHVVYALRFRRIEGGGIQYRHQCQRCGSSVGNAIGHARITQMPAEWDDDLQRQWRDSRRAISDARLTDAMSARREEYQRYLLTTEWKLRRDKVLRRARNVCEGCMEARAEEVHHLTYSHVGHELLFQLVALCAECHRRAHGMDPFDDA